jgi:hypothetical protein
MGLYAMAVSNAAGISVPQSAAKQIDILLKYLDKLPDIIRDARSLSYGVTLFQVLNPLSEKLGLPYDELQNVFSALENMRFMEIEFGSVDEVMSRLTSAISPDLAKRIDENRDALVLAINHYREDNPISIAIKAQRLAYYFEHIYRDGEIITDMRPVFDAKGDDILEIIITHSLVVTHSSTGSGGNERMHLAMDAGDVLKLRRACDRAIAKANTLKREFGNGRKWQIHLLRDNDNAS